MPQQSGGTSVFMQEIIIHCDTLYKIGIDRVLWEPKGRGYPN